MSTPKDTSSPTVGLFITCPVDLMRPSIAWAAVALLEQAGCRVEVPPQSCCGQVGYNSGETDSTQQVAQQLIETFERFNYLVTPSGSCAGMIRHHYPNLLASDPIWQRRAQALANKSFELTQFLCNERQFTPVAPNCDLSERIVTYHDSCAGLRELSIKEQPRQLLQACANLSVREMQESEVCCGFGGTFAVKMPELSGRLASDKLEHATESGAEVLVGGDLSCLLQIAGRAKQQGSPIEVRHVAEVLAGDLSTPAIGEEQS